MLTHLKELEKVKCHQYYPSLNETLTFEDITVETVKDTNLITYYKREFRVTKHELPIIGGSEQTSTATSTSTTTTSTNNNNNNNNGSSNGKIIYQYHFQKWPDHDCPKHSIDLIRFIETVKNEKKSSAPIIVHCSAGVGRTGTFIALDILMQRIKEEKMINIYKVVKELRHQRVKMVQTLVQYRFIYKSVVDLINEKKIRKCKYKIINNCIKSVNYCLYKFSLSQKTEILFYVRR